MLKNRFLVSLLLLLFSSVYISAQNNIYNKMFRDAITSGNEKDIVYSLDKGADVDCLDKDGFSALHLAVKDQDKVLVDYLLQRNANVNVVDLNKCIPIMYSAYQGDLRMCYLLYKKGANLVLKDNFGNNSIDYAKKQGFIRVAKFLENPKSYSEELTYVEYGDSAVEYRYKNDVKKAVFFMEKARKAAKIELSENNSEYLITLNYLAGRYTDAGDYNKAEQLYKEVIEKQKILFGENQKDYATSLNDLALLYCQTGKYESAEPLYLLSLEVENKISGEKSTRYATTLNNLGLLYYYKNDNSKALKYIEKALKIRKEQLGEKDPDYANSLNSLALVYSEMKNYERAETLYKEIIEILKDGQVENNLNYATSLYNLATLYVNMESYTKAEPFFLEALEIKKGILGENHPDYVSSLNNVAKMYENMKNFDRAEQLYYQSIKLIKVAFGDKHASYVTSLGNLASFYENTFNYTKAAEITLQILKIQKVVLGENHPDYAKSLTNLAFEYQKLRNFEKAELLYLQSAKIQKEVLGELNSDYATTLYALANMYMEMEKFTQSEIINKQVVEIRKKTVGENSLDYATSLNNLALCYQKMGSVEKAIPFFKQSINILKNGSTNFDKTNYANMLDNLSTLYKETGQYSLSETLCKEALSKRKEIYGENHPYFAISLGNLASLFMGMGKYSEAEKLYLQSLEIEKEVLGEKHPDYANTLNSLALCEEKLGNFIKAKHFFEESLNIRRQVFGEKSIVFAGSLNNLASFEEDLGNFKNAESLYLRALEICKEVLGETNPIFATYLVNLGGLYNKLEKFQKAELMLLQSLKIRREIYGEKNLAFANSLNSLANFYDDLGDYSKAETLCQQALKIQKELLGENHPDFAKSLNSLAGIYLSQEKFTDSELLYKEVIKIAKKNFGETHPDYANPINNLGWLYLTMKKYDQAEPYFIQALKIWKDNFGENNISYTTSLSSLAVIYTNIENYIKANQMFEQILKINTEILGKNHPQTNSSLYSLAVVNLNSNNYSKGIPLYFEAYNTSKKDIVNKFTYLSEKDRYFYWSSKESIYNVTYPSMAYRYRQKNDILSFAYDNALFTKGLLLNTSLQIQNSVLQSGDSALIKIYENLRGLKRIINLLQSNPLAQQGDLSVMEAQADSLDKVLTQKSQLYKRSQFNMQGKWTDVQKSLKYNEVAIEFISFKNYSNKALFTDSIMYCALVLKKDSKYPEMIPLFEEKQLDSLFVKSVTDVNQLYTYRVTNLRKDSVENKLNYGSKLYNLVWKPLDASLKNMKTVYYAPSGKLNQVAFAAIPVDSTVLLSDKYNLHQVTSTRQVIKNTNATNKVQDATLFGGIQYELDTKQLAQVQNIITETNYRSVFVADSTQRSGTFSYLKGTDDEVKGIANEFKQKGLTDQLFTGAIASETAFKKLSGTNTDIIHIATHGFYLPVEETKREDFRFMGLDNERRNVVMKNPLLRSGLAFAGANRAWRGDSIPDNWEDGILTAHEISQINLTNTELVVLSACETGLGDNGGSEGVFGLQRAFKMAGVQTLIMSLWKVPDTQTSQLMQGFYKYWLGGMTKHDAFKKAQNEVRKANPNPYYWAAFVMVD